MYKPYPALKPAAQSVDVGGDEEKSDRHERETEKDKPFFPDEEQQRELDDASEQQRLLDLHPGLPEAYADDEWKKLTNEEIKKVVRAMVAYIRTGKTTNSWVLKLLAEDEDWIFYFVVDAANFLLRREDRRCNRLISEGKWRVEHRDYRVFQHSQQLVEKAKKYVDEMIAEQASLEEALATLEAARIPVLEDPPEDEDEERDKDGEGESEEETHSDSHLVQSDGRNSEPIRSAGAERDRSDVRGLIGAKGGSGNGRLGDRLSGTSVSGLVAGGGGGGGSGASSHSYGPEKNGERAPAVILKKELHPAQSFTESVMKEVARVVYDPRTSAYTRQEFMDSLTDNFAVEFQEQLIIASRNPKMAARLGPPESWEYGAWKDNFSVAKTLDVSSLMLGVALGKHNVKPTAAYMDSAIEGRFKGKIFISFDKDCMRMLREAFDSLAREYSLLLIEDADKGVKFILNRTETHLRKEQKIAFDIFRILLANIEQTNYWCLLYGMVRRMGYTVGKSLTTMALAKFKPDARDYMIELRKEVADAKGTLEETLDNGFVLAAGTKADYDRRLASKAVAAGGGDRPLAPTEGTMPDAKGESGC